MELFENASDSAVGHFRKRVDRARNLVAQLEERPVRLGPPDVTFLADLIAGGLPLPPRKRSAQPDPVGVLPLDDHVAVLYGVYNPGRHGDHIATFILGHAYLETHGFDLDHSLSLLKDALGGFVQIIEAEGEDLAAVGPSKRLRKLARALSQPTRLAGDR
jgi:hypothetical protein